MPTGKTDLDIYLCAPISKQKLINEAIHKTKGTDA